MAKSRIRPAAAAGDEPPDFAGLRAQLRSRIASAAPEIVVALITKAEAGSWQHAKFLFELAGIAAEVEQRRDEPSLMQELLERFEREGKGKAQPAAASG